MKRVVEIQRRIGLCEIKVVASYTSANRPTFLKNMTEKPFICPLDVGLLSSDLSTPEALANFLNYFGIGIEGINQIELPVENHQNERERENNNNI